MRFLICGLDVYRSRRKLNVIRERFRQTRDSVGLNTLSFRLPENSVDSLIESILTPPFLGEKKFISAEGYLSAKIEDQTALKLALESKPESSIIVFFESTDLSSLSKSPLLPLLKNQDFTEEFQALNEQQAVSFMASECEVSGLKIEVVACQELARVHNGNSWALTRDLSKLCSLALAQERQIITLAMVKDSVNLDQEESIFEFLDACFEGFPKKAVISLERLTFFGTDQFQILSMISRQIRLFLGVKDLIDRGVNDRYLAAKKLGMHPFPVGKAMRLVKGLKKDDLKRYLEQILSLEERMKTGQTNSLVELTLFASSKH